jgi:ADP-heptose:LPS heptosyltransferase
LCQDDFGYQIWNAMPIIVRGIYRVDCPFNKSAHLFVDLPAMKAIFSGIQADFSFTMAKVLITNDSGSAHFASLTEIECLTLFGPEPPALYGPPGPHAKNFFAYLACSPCLSAHNHRHTICKMNRCLQTITLDEVTVQALHQLTGSIS